MEKKPPTKFYGILVHFLRTCEVAKFSMIKLYTFGFFVDVILFYEEKGSFYVKVITLASGPL